MPKQTHRSQKGFTLIELMIVVVVIGILTMIAFPSYQNHVRKGYRASAQSHLMNIAQKQQQFLLDRRSFAASEAELGITQTADVSRYYTVTFNVPASTPPTFTVTATPRPGTLQAKDVVLTIDQAGSKTPANVW